MARLLPLALTALMLLAAFGLGAHLPRAEAAEPNGTLVGNDAGSGRDAGDTPDAALTIPNARRPWSANLTPPGTDADWYRVDATTAYCAVADVTTTAPGLLTLAATADRSLAVQGEAAAHGTTRLALAASAGTAPLLGLEPAALSLMASDSGTRPSPGRYTFSLYRATFAELDPEGDGDSPDAGATPATAAALSAGCAAGRIATGAADAEDHYGFDVTTTRHLTLALAVHRGDAAQLRVVTPSGATYAVAPAGQTLDVWADEPGRWHVVVAHGSSGAAAGAGTSPAPGLGLLLGPDGGASATLLESDYLLSASDGPPGDTQPCRPSCLE